MIDPADDTPAQARQGRPRVRDAVTIGAGTLHLALQSRFAPPVAGTLAVTGGASPQCKFDAIADDGHGIVTLACTATKLALRPAA